MICRKPGNSAEFSEYLAGSERGQKMGGPVQGFWLFAARLHQWSRGTKCSSASLPVALQNVAPRPTRRWRLPPPSGGGLGWGRKARLPTNRANRMVASRSKEAFSLTPSLSRWERELRVQRGIQSGVWTTVASAARDRFRPRTYGGPGAEAQSGVALRFPPHSKTSPLAPRGADNSLPPAGEGWGGGERLGPSRGA